MARKTKTGTGTGTEQPPEADVPVSAAAAEPVGGRVTLKKKDFLDLAIARAGIRKSDARAAIDATLATLGAALSSGQDVVLPPLGKLRVLREKPSKQGRVLMLRLVLDESAAAAADPLAARDDQG